MAGNQREMERKEKRAKKDKRNKTIIWIVIAVIIVILAVMKICEVNINSVKDRFTDENGNFTITNGTVEDNFPYNLDSSKGVVLKNVNKKIGILTPTSFTVLDSGDGDVQYTFDHGYSNPIMRESGIYVLIYDQGAKSFRLDTTKEAVYETQAKRNIFCADVAKDGSVAYATTSSEKKCDIYVYNHSLKEKLSVSISEGYVVAIAISDNSAKLSYVTVNSENAQLKYTLHTMDIRDGEETASLALPRGNVVDMDYSSGNVYVIGDSYISVVTNQKNLKEVYAQGTINTEAYTFTSSNDLIIAFNGYANSTDNTLARVNSNGRIKAQVDVTGTVKSVSASSSAVSVLTGSEILSYKLYNLNQTESAVCDDSVKSICRMGSDIFIHRQSLLDRNEAEE